LPLGLFAGLLMQYRDAQRARAHISRGIRYYLPEQVAAGLAEGPFDPAALHQRVYATCMVSDIEGFTRVAEAMPPEVLKPLLDSYLEILIGAVQRRHGAVTDIVGDGTTCVWMPAPGANSDACAAALDIGCAVAAFNRAHDRGLPTRIGLHAGWVMVGNVGGGGRFAYSVVGDTVNTASRIEQLNKQLGTYLLASDAVTAGQDEYLVRPLGRFRLVGKTEALRLGELRGRADEPHDAGLLAAFAQALAAFEDARWKDAARGFEHVLADHPGDGPARFYLHWCRRYLARTTLPADPTVIQLEQK
jgi:adenylate cyclase